MQLIHKFTNAEKRTIQKAYQEYLRVLNVIASLNEDEIQGRNVLMSPDGEGFLLAAQVEAESQQMSPFSLVPAGKDPSASANGKDAERG